MRPSFTVRFFSFVTPTQSVNFAVPSGFRAVLRNVTAYSENQGGLAYVIVAGVLVWYWSSPGARGFTSFETRAVCYQGTAMSGTAVGTTVSLQASGYLFREDPSDTTQQLPAPAPEFDWSYLEEPQELGVW